MTAIAIAVPVRNEAERLPRLLAALAGQSGTRDFTLCLFFDNCDDGSVALAESLAATLPYRLATDCCTAGGPPNAGRARGRAMALALARAPEGIVLTTDADSAPAPDWVTANLAGIARADVVAGRIVREGAPSARQDQVEGYYDRLHGLRRMLDPVTWDEPTAHHWTSGASLAMPAAVYRALGGFAPVPHGEDAAFCDAAARAGYRVRRDTAVVVRTSARRHGRALHGFAAALAALDGTDTLPETAHPEDEAWRYGLHGVARAAHGSTDYALLAQRLGLPLAEVTRVAAECTNGEAFAARIVGAPAGGLRSIGLGHAEALLAALEQDRLRGAA